MPEASSDGRRRPTTTAGSRGASSSRLIDPARERIAKIFSSRAAAVVAARPRIT